MLARALLIIICLAALIGSPRAQAGLTVSIIAEGLFHPIGMALLPDGGVLIAEAGNGKAEYSAGISLLRPDGSLGRLVSGIPGGSLDGSLMRAPALAVSPDGADIVMGFPGAGIYRLPSSSARRHPQLPFTARDLDQVEAHPGAGLLLHPFDIAFAADGAIIISDAASSSLTLERGDGTIQFLHRFAPLQHPSLPARRLPALPTGLAAIGTETYVTLFGGCPHAPNSGELAAINADGGRRSAVAGLNMPIDVAADARGNIWLLEFAAVTGSEDCFEDLDEGSKSGRLSRIKSDGSLETALAGLSFPGGLLPLPDGSLYVSEVYAGRILHLRFDDPRDPPKRYPPARAAFGESREIADVDGTLRALIDRYGLSAYPGREIKEGDSALARLGRDLFFDPILSGDRNIACATCHHPQFAMTDGRVLPIGSGGHGLGEARVFRPRVQVSSDSRFASPGEIANPFIGEFVPRNSPSVINSALLQRQFWDGRVERLPDAASVSTKEDEVNALALEDPLLAQALFPIVSELEMAGVTFGLDSPVNIRAALLERLRAIPGYRSQFQEVFGSSQVSIQQVAAAIAAFQRQLIFTESPWDDYIAGDRAALSIAAKRGALLFYGARHPDLNCASCHSGDLFTDQNFHNLLSPQIGPGADNGESEREDFGRANVSFDYRDQYRFRTAGLRNVELTAPYLHNGAYRGLADVIWHHADIWRANMVYDPAAQLPEDFQSAVLPYDFERQAHSASLHLSAGLPLQEDDVADLVQFLGALTDPAARDLSHLRPAAVPSGLPLDPLGG